MSTDIVTVDVDRSVAAATKRMLSADVGSVIVLQDGTPYGIITESDVMEAALKTDRPISEIPLAKAMTNPVKTISPAENLLTVAEKMQTHGVKRFPVMDHIELVGIITFSDLIWHASELMEGDDSEDEFFSQPV